MQLISTRVRQVLAIALVLPWTLIGAADADDRPSDSASFRDNGVTAHRGNSAAFPENTMAAFESAIEAGADWIELDIFRSNDGKLVVIHDKTTQRTGDKNLSVTESSYDELKSVDVATDFRRRTGTTLTETPAAKIPLLEDVLQMVMQQDRTRVSIQPKMDCVADAVALVKQMHAERWVGFNDGNLKLMSEVKRLAPEIQVFWDRGPETNIDDDIRIAKQHGFESLVLHYSGITPEKVQKISAAGIRTGVWTVNDRATMERLIGIGVERLYTDDPRMLLSLKKQRDLRKVTCEGTYPQHLQGICADHAAIYWSFTTRLVKTDLDGKVLKQISVANHHGDLCFHDGKLYIAVNLGKFNEPAGKADSWVYVYDADSLKELARHEAQEAVHGAGGISFREGHFFVVGGLPAGVDENYVYEYDGQFNFVKKHVIHSGYTLMGIQTATFAHGRWWFGCYGETKKLLITDEKFQMLGSYPFQCSLGIEAWSNGQLLSASGRCRKGHGCSGELQLAIPHETAGLQYRDAQ
ncbi:Glycerophosphoryl diester phosphodiesterase [Novipirellula galeiformis]|uniref:Glycerophosphoryl diester phosphodiesterase n=1 Tax=Novipirellula galeiformis TaxID=2528004 RepID=A0A5C6CPA4_9BACT|nr:Glycerophosphoryl diester phosphodiesterase [Novipirellula galeiformis]